MPDSPMTVSKINAKPIHEVLEYVEAMIKLWVAGADVAIPYLVGTPGIAKTSLLLQMCQRNDWNLLHLHFIRPIEEISGMPDFKDIEINEILYRGTMWRLPEVLTELYKIAGNGKTTVWFLDDYHLASPAHLHLSYEMFSQDRKLRGYEIPKNVGFVLAGNDSSKAGAKSQFSAVMNRCAKFPVTLDFDFWKNTYAYEHGVNQKVVSFLSHASYKQWFCGEEKVDRPWPSPRSWTRFARMLSIIEANRKNPSHEEVLYLGSSHLGEEGASDFTGYYKIYSKIDMAGVYNGKIDILIPDEMVNRYVYVIAATLELVDRAAKQQSIVLVARALDTYSRILGEMTKVSSELAIVGLKEIVILEKSLQIKKLFQAVMAAIKKICSDSVYQQIIEDVRYT
jgi:hypothetical protein